MSGKKIDNLTISVLVLFVFVLLTMRIVSSREEFALEVEKPSIPAELADWKLLGEVVIPEDILKILGTKAATLGEYRNAAGEKIDLYILKSSGRRSTIHSPEYCYLGSGKNELLKRGKYDVSLDSGKTLKVNYLFIQIEGGFQTVVYFYTANQLKTHNYYKQQLFFILKRLKNEPVEGCLMRVAKFSRNNDLEPSLESLQPVVRELVR
ncbi:MAG: EpsI family protein [PVC group bacterium]|nr:EpsI family protein [PVC group bacterium]